MLPVIGGCIGYLIHGRTGAAVGAGVAVCIGLLAAFILIAALI
jgi:hypothetical protein